MPKTKRLKQAFEGSRESIYLLDPDEVIIIDDPKDPRYDPREALPLTATFVESIRRRGVISPVVIRKDGERAILVDGRQRCKALRLVNAQARKAGEPARQLPCRVRKDADHGHALVMAEANNQRMDDSPIEKARKAVGMINAGIPRDEVRIAFGCDNDHQLDELTNLLDLAEPVQEAIAKGRLSVSAGAIMRVMNHEDQAAKLDALVVEPVAGGKPKRATVREIKKAAGHRIRPSGKELKERIEAILELSTKNTPRVNRERCDVALAVLRWASGEGKWEKAHKAVIG